MYWKIHEMRVHSMPLILKDEECNISQDTL